MIWAFVGLYAAIHICGISNTVGYHRLLTHRSFKTNWLIRNGLTLFAAQYSGSPMQWVGAHRVHHTLSDREGDPHSPKDGFWHAHAGWMFNTKNVPLCILATLSGFGLQFRFLVVDVLRLAGIYDKKKQVWKKMTRDLQKERFMRLLDAPLVIPAMFAGQVTAVLLIGGWWGLAWLWAAHFVLNNFTWAVNSICHLPSMGVAPFAAKDQSRNVWWLTLMTHGEANHNAHHKYPKSARHGLNGELDPSWTFIRTLEKLGLATEVQLPKKIETVEQPTAIPKAA